jgi:hypothetical protein
LAGLGDVHGALPRRRPVAERRSAGREVPGPAAKDDRRRRDGGVPRPRQIAFWIGQD